MAFDAPEVAAKRVIRVTSSLPLPQPPIFSCDVKTSTVMTAAGAVVAPVIHSSSGAYYQISDTIKGAIYGRIALGHVLEDTGDLSSGYTDTISLRQTDSLVAVKIMNKNEVNRMKESSEDVWNEIATMHFIKNYKPNTVAPFEPVLDGPNRYDNLVYIIESAENDNFIFNIMEYIDGGDICDNSDALADRDDVHPSDVARRLAKMAIEGIVILHSLGICHRDISAENIMVTADLSRCVIIDFGMSLRCSRDTSSGGFNLLPPLGQVGRSRYMSPEVFLNAAPFDPSKSDIWALGVVIFVLLTNLPLFQSANKVDPVFRKIANGQLAQLCSQWGLSHVDPAAIDLLSKTLDVNPQSRAESKKLLSHSWLSG